MKHKAKSISDLADVTSIKKVETSNRMGILALLNMFKDKLLVIGNCDTVYKDDTTSLVSLINNNCDKTVMVASTTNTSVNKLDSERIDLLIDIVTAMKGQIVSIKKEFGDFKGSIKKQLSQLASIMNGTANNEMAINGNDNFLSPLNKTNKE